MNRKICPNECGESIISDCLYVRAYVCAFSFTKLCCFSQKKKLYLHWNVFPFLLLSLLMAHFYCSALLPERFGWCVSECAGESSIEEILQLWSGEASQTLMLTNSPTRWKHTLCSRWASRGSVCGSLWTLYSPPSLICFCERFICFSSPQSAWLSRTGVIVGNCLVREPRPR